MDPSQFYDTPWPMLLTILALNASTHFLKWALGKGLPFTQSGAWAQWFPRAVLLIQTMALALAGWFPGDSTWAALPDALAAFGGSLAAFHLPKRAGMPTGSGTLLVAFLGFWGLACSGSALSVVDGPALDGATLTVDYGGPHGVTIDHAISSHVSLNVGNVTGVLVGSITIGDGVVFGNQMLMISVASFVGLSASFEFDTETGWAETCVTLVLIASKTPFRLCWPMEIGERHKPPELKSNGRRGRR